MGGAVGGGAVLRCTAPLWTATAGAARALIARGRHLLHTHTHTHTLLSVTSPAIPHDHYKPAMNQALHTATDYPSHIWFDLFYMDSLMFLKT